MLFTAVGAIMAMLPSLAFASSSQERMLQDNALLISDSVHLDRTLAQLRSLGVSRIRISVLWDRIAPASTSWTRPHNFLAPDPAAYSAASWAPYDRIVGAAAGYGIRVDFDLMGGAPLWATKRPPEAKQLHVWYPSSTDFGQFVAAVGTRYSGHYRPTGSLQALPAVNYWSIWNEPNVGGSSLAPQTINGIEVAPTLYRNLVRQGYQSLLRTGHRHDTILIGELASTGHPDPGIGLGMEPLRFLRALYCVNSKYHPLTGRAASRRGCSSPRSFRGQNPGLFNLTGWAHHPYHLTDAPDVRSPARYPDWVTLADLPRLERALDLVQRAYGSHRRLSIYLTEYGFDTKPPQPKNAVSLSNQAAYLNQSEYIAWRDSRVQVISQYLLKDDPTKPGYLYSAFTSGLIFLNGRHKPSFDAYQLPVWIPDASARTHVVHVWGSARAVISMTHQSAAIIVQFQRSGHGRYSTLTRVKVTGGHGYFYVPVHVTTRGNVRLIWQYRSGRHLVQGMTSRTVAVRG